MSSATAPPTSAAVNDSKSADPKGSKEVFEQFTTKAIQGFALWADANQKALRQLIELSTATAAESARVQAELQSSVVQALKNGQSYILAEQKRATALPKDPVGTYQQSVVDSVEGAQRALTLLEASADTITKSAERLQQVAEQTSKGIQSTFATLTRELRTLYTPEGQ